MPFVELQLLFFLLPERAVAIKEKFIELRRLDTGATEHPVDLATVVDLMFEQVQ